jgi:hypothetical protein
MAQKKLNLKVRLFGMSVLFLAYSRVVRNLLHTTWELVLLASVISENCIH